MLLETAERLDPADPTHFREALSHFPSGMVAVTAAAAEPIGFAIGSFVSISLEPPLVGFFVDRSSTTWPRLRRVGGFGISVLGSHQEEICRGLSRKGVDRFAGIDLRNGPHGTPLIADSLAWIECDLDEVIPVGDHLLVVGRVAWLELGAEVEPLVFHRGGFGAGGPSKVE